MNHKQKGQITAGIAGLTTLAAVFLGGLAFGLTRRKLPPVEIDVEVESPDEVTGATAHVNEPETILFEEPAAPAPSPPRKKYRGLKKAGWGMLGFAAITLVAAVITPAGDSEKRKI